MKALFIYIKEDDDQVRVYPVAKGLDEDQTKFLLMQFSSFDFGKKVSETETHFYLPSRIVKVVIEDSLVALAK